LEQQSLAVAIWSLQESHHITILFEGWYTGRGYSGETLTLRRKRAAEPVTGLEAELLDAMHHKDSDIRALVQDHWMQGEELKWNEVVVLPEREAVEAGVMYRITRSGRHPRSLQWSQHLPDYGADLERIDALETPFGQFQDKIERYARADPLLWARLITECGEAIGRPKPPFLLPSVPTGH
jgi:hypothetical protein